MCLAGVSVRLLAASLATIAAIGAGWTQPAPAGPPAVGVVEATRRPITETSEFLGRIEAINRVNVVARVSAFLEQRLFSEGAEIAKGEEPAQTRRAPAERREFHVNRENRDGKPGQKYGHARGSSFQRTTVKTTGVAVLSSDRALSLRRFESTSHRPFPSPSSARR